VEGRGIQSGGDWRERQWDGLSAHVKGIGGRKGVVGRRRRSITVEEIVETSKPR
jgi:hypothetical protein